MAFPPSVPTSFAPHPAAASIRRHSDFSGAFAFFGYGVLGVVVLLAVGVFVYNSVLASEQSRKDAELAAKVAAIDPSTVEGFIRLRDRLSSGETLLGKHIAATQFFGVLSSLLPATVGFSTLHLSVNDAGTISVDAAGAAKSFNALAAASDAFAADGRIKDAIFSGISVKNNAVNFALSAAIDPTLVAFTPTAGSVATSTVSSAGSRQASSSPAALP